MTNKEIDSRLINMANAIPLHEKRLRNEEIPKLERELELMNMSLMVVWAMLGEIAKRLPESKK